MKDRDVKQKSLSEGLQGRRKGIILCCVQIIVTHVATKKFIDK